MVRDIENFALGQLKQMYDGCLYLLCNAYACKRTQKAFEDGWRVSPSAVARRSISNRFTVSLQKEVEEKVNTENVETTTEAPVAVETKPETQTTTEKPEEAPAKPLTKAQQAKLAKEEAATLAAEAETKENEGEAE